MSWLVGLEPEKRKIRSPGQDGQRKRHMNGYIGVGTEHEDLCITVRRSQWPSEELKYQDLQSTSHLFIWSSGIC